MNDKKNGQNIILSIRALKQAIYTLRNKGYSDDKICIYLTRDTIIEFAKRYECSEGEVINWEAMFTRDVFCFEGILVKVHYENKVIGIMEEIKL